MPKYDPLVIDVTQSKYGYWIVTYSVAPGLRMSVMCCKLGVTQQEAVQLVLPSVAATPVPARWT